MIWEQKVFMTIKLFCVLNCKIGAEAPIFFMKKFKNRVDNFIMQ